MHQDNKKIGKRNKSSHTMWTLIPCKDKNTIKERGKRTKMEILLIYIRAFT